MLGGKTWISSITTGATFVVESWEPAFTVLITLPLSVPIKSTSYALPSGVLTCGSTAILVNLYLKGKENYTLIIQN
jgi:hypothetical protein